MSADSYLPSIPRETGGFLLLVVVVALVLVVHGERLSRWYRLEPPRQLRVELLLPRDQPLGLTVDAEVELFGIGIGQLVAVDYRPARAPGLVAVNLVAEVSGELSAFVCGDSKAVVHKPLLGLQGNALRLSAGADLEHPSCQTMDLDLGTAAVIDPTAQLEIAIANLQRLLADGPTLVATYIALGREVQGLAQEARRLAVALEAGEGPLTLLLNDAAMAGRLQALGQQLAAASRGLVLLVERADPTLAALPGALASLTETSDTLRADLQAVAGDAGTALAALPPLLLQTQIFLEETTAVVERLGRLGLGSDAAAEDQRLSPLNLAPAP